MTRRLLQFGRVTALVTLVTTAGCGTALEAQASEQTEVAVATQLLGAWRLVNWTQRLADGSERPAQTDTGYLIYTSGNRMCAMLMDSRRPKWAPGAPATVADAVARSAGYISYCGSVQINAKEGFILHHVDVERNPNNIGTTRKRWFRFPGPDVLRLSIDAAELQSGVKESVLVWQRVVK
ncbi:MAG: lipocalin-like domain-containing protein [Vicinamibacterales bacterium]